MGVNPQKVFSPYWRVSQMLGDPKLSMEDKNLLNELVGKSFEKDEDVDKDVRMNPNTLQ